MSAGASGSSGASGSNGASGSSGASGSHPPFDVAVLSRSLERCPDPVALYAALCHGRPDTALLESADHSTASGSQSLLMSRAALRIVGRGRRVTLDALSANGRDLLAGLARRHPEATASDTGERLVLDYPPPATGDERARLLAPSPLDAVREAVLSLRVTGAIAPRPPLAIGAFAYDLLGVYEALPEPASDPLAWPDFELWVAEEVVAIEHDKHRATALRFVFGGITPPQNSPAYHDASRALAELVTRIETIPAAPPPGEPPRLPPELGAEVDQDDAAYCATVTTLKEHIRRGDIFQIVPSRSFRRPCPDALAAYAELRALNPSPYMFFLHGSAGQLFGASPESALTVRGPARRLRINPIAGTRPRGRDASGAVDHDLDARLEAELRLDHKEIAEHMMLVDLARNDVARVSKPGTRVVERLLDVVRYSHVMHLVSLVAGELDDDLDALHAYVATMNMGTLVGAPKLRAASLLREHEPSRRGPYGGAVGYLTAEGELDTCIVIRSAVVQDGVAHVRAGGGVVYDSDPQAEADETRRKAGAVLAALRRAAEEAQP